MSQGQIEGFIGGVADLIQAIEKDIVSMLREVAG
jgi:hypothetical protein